MSDDDAFRKAIDNEPNDLSLKLVYADWLEERGDPRAEVVRHQAKEPLPVPPANRRRHPFYAWVPTFFFIANEALVYLLDRPERVADESGGRWVLCCSCAEYFAVVGGLVGLLLGFVEAERHERRFYRIVLALRAQVVSIMAGALFGWIAGWLGWGFYLCLVWYYLWRGA